MYGITLDNGKTKMHTFNDFGLYLSSFEIGQPVVKTEYINIVGGNGSLDLSEVYGEVYYEDRTHTITFQALDDKVRWTELLDKITAYVHGKTFKITADYNLGWYYVGRLSIDKYATSKRLATIVFKAICEPYKYKRYKTIKQKKISKQDTLNCHNSRMIVCPTFKSNSDMSITFNDVTYSLKKDTETQFEDVLFKEGNNYLTINGNGTIEVTYQEGTL